MLIGEHQYDMLQKSFVPYLPTGRISGVMPFAVDGM
jgi:hypothetical protein